LLELNGWSKEETLFFGDKIEEGGNDFPVRQMGVDSIGVRGWEDTAYALEGINAVS
jgi:HAD hydrolase, family IIB